jgi:hypothetical protein
MDRPCSGVGADVASSVEIDVRGHGGVAQRDGGALDVDVRQIDVGAQPGNRLVVEDQLGGRIPAG